MRSRSGCSAISCVALVEQERHGGGGLRDHAHGAVDDGVLREAFAGEGCVVARRPDGGAQGLEGEERAGEAGFGVGCALSLPAAPHP